MSSGRASWEAGRCSCPVLSTEAVRAARFARPVLGNVEVWRFESTTTGWVHPAHPHLVQSASSTARGGAESLRERAQGHRVLGPGEVVHVAMRFGDFPGTYVFHRQNLEHEDEEMMSQFRVVPVVG